MIEIELQCSIVELDVGYLCNHFFEVALSPGFGWMGHHRDDGIVVFLVLVVKEDQLGPEMSLLSCTENLRDEV